MKDGQNNQPPAANTQANSDNTNQNQAAINNPEDMKYLLSQLSNVNNQGAPNQQPKSSTCSIIGMVLGGLSFIPFVGVVSIISIIFAIIALFRRERGLMVFIAMILGIGGFVTSPILWFGLLDYECHDNKNCHESTTTTTEINSGTTQTTTSTTTSSITTHANQPTQTIQPPTPDSANITFQFGSVGPIQNLTQYNFYLYLTPSAVIDEKSLYNLASQICSKGQGFASCNIFYFQNPSMTNYACSGFIPYHLRSKDTYAYRLNARDGEKINISNTLNKSPNVNSYPVQTVVRETVAPGIQNICGGYEVSGVQNLYISFNAPQGATRANIIEAAKEYTNKQLATDINIDQIFFYTNNADAKLQYPNYSYVCQNIAGLVQCRAP